MQVTNLLIKHSINQALNQSTNQINQSAYQSDLRSKVTLVQVQEKVKAGLVPLNKYIITKQLTKRPEDYPDAKNQAHVQVALRRRAAGKRDGVMQVPFLRTYHSVLLHGF